MTNPSERMKTFWADVRAGKRPAPKRSQNGILKRKVRISSNWVKEPGRRAEYRLSTTEAFRSAVILTTRKISARVRELKKEGYGLAQARRMATKEIL